MRATIFVALVAVLALHGQPAEARGLQLSLGAGGHSVDHGFDGPGFRIGASHPVLRSGRLEWRMAGHYYRESSESSYASNEPVTLTSTQHLTDVTLRMRFGSVVPNPGGVHAEIGAGAVYSAYRLSDDRGFYMKRNATVPCVSATIGLWRRGFGDARVGVEGTGLAILRPFQTPRETPKALIAVAAFVGW